MLLDKKEMTSVCVCVGWGMGRWGGRADQPTESSGRNNEGDLTIPKELRNQQQRRPTLQRAAAAGSLFIPFHILIHRAPRQRLSD